MTHQEKLWKVEEIYEWDYVEQEGSWATRFDYRGSNSIWINTDGSIEGSIPKSIVGKLTKLGFKK
jgi:hypothetical protein